MSRRRRSASRTEIPKRSNKRYYQTGGFWTYFEPNEFFIEFYYKEIFENNLNVEIFWIDFLELFELHPWCLFCTLLWTQIIHKKPKAGSRTKHEKGNSPNIGFPHKKMGTGTRQTSGSRAKNNNRNSPKSGFPLKNGKSDLLPNKVFILKTFSPI